jgi:hypothetical protein
MSGTGEMMNVSRGVTHPPYVLPQARLVVWADLTVDGSDWRLACLLLQMNSERSVRFTKFIFTQGAEEESEDFPFFLFHN